MYGKGIGLVQICSRVWSLYTCAKRTPVLQRLYTSSKRSKFPTKAVRLANVIIQAPNGPPVRKRYYTSSGGGQFAPVLFFSSKSPH